MAQPTNLQPTFRPVYHPDIHVSTTVLHIYNLSFSAFTLHAALMRTYLKVDITATCELFEDEGSKGRMRGAM